MIEIDSRGLSCPIPVINTKKALIENPDGCIVKVDTFVAKENIVRYATKINYKTKVTENNGEWTIEINKQ